jgi:hypothetical protein
MISPLPKGMNEQTLGVVPEIPVELSGSLMTTGIKPESTLDGSLRAEFQQIQGKRSVTSPVPTLITVQPAGKSEPRPKPSLPAPILVRGDTTGSSVVSRTWDFGNALRRWSTVSKSRLAGSTPMERKSTYGSIPLSSRVSVGPDQDFTEELEDPFGFLCHLMANAGLSVDLQVR